MIDISKVPEQGTMYAAYVDRVVYEKYDRKDLEQSDIETDKLLELHLFDKEKEYRLMKSCAFGQIEETVTDAVGHDEIYKEEIFVLPSGTEKLEEAKYRKKVCIVNYLRYDDDDLLQVVDYRLQEVGE